MLLWISRRLASIYLCIEQYSGKGYRSSGKLHGPYLLGAKWGAHEVPVGSTGIRLRAMSHLVGIFFFCSIRPPSSQGSKAYSKKIHSPTGEILLFLPCFFLSRSYRELLLPLHNELLMISQWVWYAPLSWLQACSPLWKAMKPLDQSCLPLFLLSLGICPCFPRSVLWAWLRLECL